MNRLLHIACCSLLCCALSIHAGSAQACKIEIRDIADYTKGRIPESAVFQGVVVSVAETANPDGSSSQEIEFRVVRWFSGTPQANTTVMGVTGSSLESDCKGLFNFSAKKGQEWLIFGQHYQGRIIPYKRLSKRLTDGNIPPALLEQLQ